MLYYSHINEDSRVERNLLRATDYNTVVVVAGSGERVLALLDDEGVRQVHVVDVNEEALFLLQLKLSALKVLSTENYLSFCGHRPAKAGQRKTWFDQCKSELTPAAKNYCQNNLTSVEKGIVNTGHFEKFLSRVRPSINLFLGKNFKNSFRGGGTWTAFSSKRWNFLLRIFSFRFIYQLWGNKDIAFVSPDAIVKQIPLALNQLVGDGTLQSCFMAHLIFKGHMREMAQSDIPPSLQKEVLEKIKSRIASSSLTIHYHHADVLSFIQANKGTLQEPVFYSLSDILSFENAGYLKQVSEQINTQGHTLVWRTFLRNRIEKDRIHNFLDHNDIDDHSVDECTGMYQVFSSRNKV
ncbi:S-adenosylmethionine:diacylglycerol 3-amino-3-carboxypropyl transferase [Dyadobacter sp. BE34]|uniref:S-adenosylmethionine:diacylglycerol 3-amino-3-carboxypropyl transferase n=1 Tax=Dyadobacter fermentans TaxID=94254 RepID=A0ABU1R0G5_9BACT|nr:MULTISPECIES: DUF3419 family protein [Dyadobacter]MDR6806899.1 S-adenosylmethionine:diacylglycerol 3-amino-3-carboxypropyl transferase [Dyadobacter fermentans]MDR7044641.1 S-adenosylmethionine:diacylglycerol 3-amino-3-carboxypropyl transferase [Dyadobacter sp. BE242]MDR7198951.1 S-adenosylmethionine:diacylglycerol 3-amino-3-carboxypropyl transferase [Dyadobacter sp. BE34]MDR7216913.1 S-adenosylmethionine:diacylglycerol 3-amino-3-carboxypropyl transferase [Dyadobacter sp. BE31]MDR7263561.1 S